MTRSSTKLPTESTLPRADATRDTAGSPSLQPDPSIARTTGLLYLAFFIFGAVGAILIPAQIFVADDAQATMANLIDNESLARTLVLLELAIVVAQALTALWFYRLFHRVSTVAAGAVAAFGLVSAAAIMASAAVLATAVDVAFDGSLAGLGDDASTVQLLFILSGHLWTVGGVFFGLWLVPMGWLVLRSGWMPRPLGWTLMVGGVAYLLGTFATYLMPDDAAVSDLLAVPATIGELWIMGALLFIGFRRGAIK